MKKSQPRTQKPRIKKAKQVSRATKEVGGVCLIASRKYMDAMAMCIERIPGVKTRQDATNLFELWRRSPEQEYIVVGMFTNHTGISGALSTTWENTLLFVSGVKEELDRLAEKTTNGFDSTWLPLIPDDKQNELTSLVYSKR